MDIHADIRVELSVLRTVRPGCSAPLSGARWNTGGRKSNLQKFHTSIWTVKWDLERDFRHWSNAPFALTHSSRRKPSASANPSIYFLFSGAAFSISHPKQLCRSSLVVKRMELVIQHTRYLRLGFGALPVLPTCGEPTVHPHHGRPSRSAFSPAGHTAGGHHRRRRPCSNRIRQIAHH